MAQSSHQPPGDGALQSAPPNDTAPPLAPGGQGLDDMGKLSLTDDHAIYTGSSHWVTILEDVCC